MQMKQVKLNDWGDFERTLQTELAALRHTGLVVVRNFALITMTEDYVETDRLNLVLNTGTDRDQSSDFWNVDQFDHDHDRDPRGKRPQDIIYAFTIDPATTPFLVHHSSQAEALDITQSLSEHDGIVVYDPRGLQRVTKNEYWFNCNPIEVALLVFTLSDSVA
jgi:hypothetical protein